MPGDAGLALSQIGPLPVLVDTHAKLAVCPTPANTIWLKLDPALVTICAFGPNWMANGPLLALPVLELIWVICL